MTYEEMEARVENLEQCIRFLRGRATRWNELIELNENDPNQRKDVLQSKRDEVRAECAATILSMTDNYI